MIKPNRLTVARWPKYY